MSHSSSSSLAKDPTRRGFFGNYATIYKTHNPGNALHWDVGLGPAAIDVNQTRPSDGERAAGQPLPLLTNGDITVSVSKRRETAPYCWQNADADELYFIDRGRSLLGFLGWICLASCHRRIEDADSIALDRAVPLKDFLARIGLAPRAICGFTIRKRDVAGAVDHRPARTWAHQFFSERLHDKIASVKEVRHGHRPSLSCRLLESER